MVTRLGLGGGSRGLYGSFAGKTPQATPEGDAVTRLGLYGGTRSPYGSFAGKTEGGEIPAHPHLTRLGLYGGPRGLYGSFAGKTEAVIDLETPGYYGAGLRKRRDKDDEIIAVIMAIYETIH